MLHVILLTLTVLFATPEVLRLDQIQVIGTHNSYHIAPSAAVLALLKATRPDVARSLDYTHPPLAEQFDRLGIRQIELDVFADPEGGHYATPNVKVADLPPAPEDGPLRRPGLKVFHVPDIDQRSTVPTFLDALAEVRAWSSEHAKHVPILVLVELKDDAIPGLTRPVRFDAETIEVVDREIRTVFKPEEMLCPDDIRGEAESLRDVIRAQGWPRLDEVRGKVLFALDNEGRIRDLYLKGHPSLRGRVMFATVEEDDPAAAWFKINDPIGQFDRIQRLVRGGFLVRTRADADTRQSRENDPVQREKALASGAQFVSTDYPEPDARFSEYRVRLPDGVVARPNPVNTPDDLKSTKLEP